MVSMRTRILILLYMSISITGIVVIYYSVWRSVPNEAVIIKDIGFRTTGVEYEDSVELHIIDCVGNYSPKGKGSIPQPLDYKTITVYGTDLIPETLLRLPYAMRHNRYVVNNRMYLWLTNNYANTYQDGIDFRREQDSMVILNISQNRLISYLGIDSWRPGLFKANREWYFCRRWSERAFYDQYRFFPKELDSKISLNTIYNSETKYINAPIFKYYLIEMPSIYSSPFDDIITPDLEEIGYKSYLLVDLSVALQRELSMNN